ncbi:hypothetical protein GGR54DRAFT_450844 [Hypoxylon sp. NC1633]|nr:hypothetical protein GGR54DRAFT_450844 [Hypoxylon sp. NC1633]
MSPEHQHRQQPLRQGPARRELIKGKLRPPAKPPSTKSYTIAPASINEVIVRPPTKPRDVRDPVEISSAATAQPFVDPAVLSRRRRNNDPT